MDYKSKYFPGKLIVLIIEHFNLQKQIKTENDINYWKEYVKVFYSEKCTYCIIMNQNGKEWTFKSSYLTLPFIFKDKYDENVSLISVNIEDSEEYLLEASNKYLLKIKNFSKIEKYSDNFVITSGELRVIFDEKFKIEIYEFLSKNHQEIPMKEYNCSLVNDFGITPQFSRTLIISEALTEMNQSINEFIEKFDNN